MLYNTLMLLSYIACRTPRPILLAVGWVLGNLYYLIIAKMRRRAVAQMMPALGIGEAEAKRLVRASFINMARNVLDILAMPMLNEKNLGDYIEIDHMERMEEALAEGRGVVVLTGHIGCWEWLSAAFTLNGMPVSAIAKPQPNIQYTRVLDDLRATIHVEIFSRGTSELLAAARALKGASSASSPIRTAVPAAHSLSSLGARRPHRSAPRYSHASSNHPCSPPLSSASQTASIGLSSVRSCAARTRGTATVTCMNLQWR